MSETLYRRLVQVAIVLFVAWGLAHGERASEEATTAQLAGVER